MASKKIFYIFFIPLVLGTVFILLKWGITLFPAFFAISSESEAKLTYYNQIFPQNEVDIPYKIQDYKAIYLNNWYFDNLTAKVKENKKNTDFWMYQNNWDVLFGSDEYFYVRKSIPFISEVTGDMVGKVTFSVYSSENTAEFQFSPDFTENEICTLTDMIMSEVYLTSPIQNPTYISDNNGHRILWNILFDFKSTDDVCYDGLYYKIPTLYWFVKDTNENLYLVNFNNQYYLLPKDISDCIIPYLIDVQ